MKVIVCFCWGFFYSVAFMLKVLMLQTPGQVQGLASLLWIMYVLITHKHTICIVV